MGLSETAKTIKKKKVQKKKLKKSSSVEEIPRNIDLPNKKLDELIEEPGGSEDDISVDGDNKEEIDSSEERMDEEAEEVDDDDDGDEDDDEDVPKKTRKTGVLYFSFIPPMFTPEKLKNYFEKIAPGMIGRVYFEKNKKSKSRETRYLEGWLEIKRKKLAKRIADTYDNSIIGGKKRDFVTSMLWNIKYLSGFKWVHLTEQLEYEKAVENKRMQVEVTQARRIASHFEEQVEKGARLKRLEQKVLKAGGKWDQFQREVQQKKTTKRKNKSQKSVADDDVMKLIFAE